MAPLLSVCGRSLRLLHTVSRTQSAAHSHSHTVTRTLLHTRAHCSCCSCHAALPACSSSSHAALSCFCPLCLSDVCRPPERSSPTSTEKAKTKGRKWAPRSHTRSPRAAPPNCLLLIIAAHQPKSAADTLPPRTLSPRCLARCLRPNPTGSSSAAASKFQLSRFTDRKCRPRPKGLQTVSGNFAG